MEFTLHTELSELPGVAWNELASAGISDTPFARHEYLSLWWKTRGGGEWAESELMLVSAHEAGRLVGIAPLFAAEHEGRRALLLVGSIEISDYLDLIVRESDALSFVGGLLDFLGSSPIVRGLPLDWYNIPESSPTLRALKAGAEERGWMYEMEVFRPTPQIALGGDFEAYLAGLEKKQRHEIKRKMRRAAEGPSPARFELLTDPSDLHDGIEAFLELMAQDAEKQRFLSPSMMEHMRSLMHLTWEQGYCGVGVPDLGERSVRRH
jgi:CelD/BcsL family acetyltransferase involved in cellulose biosynthesis